jgi:predicted transcriptional regulator of viral defense system
MARVFVLDRLYEIAEGQDGYITTRQAEQNGVSRVALAKAEGRGRLERVSHGVYRLTRYPYQASRAQYWEAVLWPAARLDVRGVLSHHTALVLHGLSDVNPARVHITLPPKFPKRRSPPTWLTPHYRELAPESIVLVDGLPVTSVERTLRDIAAAHDLAALDAAIADLRARGLTVPKDLLSE